MRREADIDGGESCKGSSRWMSRILFDEVNNEAEFTKGREISETVCGQESKGRGVAAGDRQTDLWHCYQSRQLFLWEPTLRTWNELLI